MSLIMILACGFYPRAREGRDQERPKYLAERVVSIRAPVKDATS